MSNMDVELSRLNALLEAHSLQDNVNFGSMQSLVAEVRDDIREIKKDINELKLVNATNSGEKAAARRAAAMVSGVVSVLATVVFNYLIKHAS